MRRTSQRICQIIASAILSVSLSLPAHAAEYAPNFKDTDIKEFINVVGKNLKKTIIVDPNVRGKVTVRSYDLMNDAQYYQFFLNVLQVYGFSVVEMPNGVLKILRAKDASKANVPVVDGDEIIGDEVVTRVVPVYNVSVRELSPLLRQFIDAAGGGVAVSYDPSNVIIMTGQAAVINRVADIIERVDQSGDQEVDIIKLRFASASEMVRIVENIDKNQGSKKTSDSIQPRVVADDRTNSIIISGDPKARERLKKLIERLDQELETSGNTRVIYLKYAKAEDLVKVLQGVSDSIQAEEQGQNTANNRSRNNRSVSIESHDDSNALVITAEPDMLRSLEEVIRQLDIRRAQIQVEAIIVEVYEGDGTTLGVQWASEDYGAQQFSSTNIPIAALGVAAYQAQDRTSTRTVIGTETGNATSYDETVEGDASSLADLLSGVNGMMWGVMKDDWAAIVQAVSTDTNSNILATPHITTMDNEEAYFIAGEEVPIITGTTTGDNNSNPFQTVDRQEVGIKLKVKPQINEGDAVQLTIEQEVSSVSGATAVDISINKREIKTSVLVDDSGVVVLGGLIDDQVQESVSKVPLLGDIPILGHLFKSTSSTVRKRNLLVFIRPTIIRDGTTSNQISHAKYNYIRAEQLKRRADGVSLMPTTETPVLPEWNDSLELPESYDEYLRRKEQGEKKEGE